MKKIIFILFLSSFFTHTSYAVSLKEASLAVQKARTCYLSLPSNYRSAVSKSYFDASNYLSDGRKYLNMKGQERLALAFFRNAKVYADLVLQVGRNMGSRSC
tara:strand:- start:165 stop:470 length:306 start_codon:yes stop_codon:yes gene_type:complete